VKREKGVSLKSVMVKKKQESEREKQLSVLRLRPSGSIYMERKKVTLAHVVKCEQNSVKRQLDAVWWDCIHQKTERDQ
jgi:hypothetical protein